MRFKAALIALSLDSTASHAADAPRRSAAASARRLSRSRRSSTLGAGCVPFGSPAQEIHAARSASSRDRDPASASASEEAAFARVDAGARTSAISRSSSSRCWSNEASLSDGSVGRRATTLQEWTLDLGLDQGAKFHRANVRDMSATYNM